MNKYVVGEIVYVDLIGAIGDEEKSEPKEPRACVILYISEIMKKCFRLVIVVPLTEKKHTWYTVVKLKEDSYALCHQIRVVSIDRIQSPRRKKEVIDEIQLKQIKTVLVNMLNI